MLSCLHKHSLLGNISNTQRHMSIDILAVIQYITTMNSLQQDRLAAAGRLLMQGSFSVWRENKRIGIRDLRFKPMQRHIFLYEKLVLFCKRKDEPDRADKASYIYKHSLQVMSRSWEICYAHDSVKGEQSLVSFKFKFEHTGDCHGSCHFSINYDNCFVVFVFATRLLRLV